jgi:hypothetical protein
MIRRPYAALLGITLAAAVVAVSCGEVPTLADGIAYITPVELPSPAVAAGDMLRDSLGRPAPLRVRAFDRDSQEITGLTVTFVPTALPSDVTIDADGHLAARDTLRSVQLVGRIGDRLQTPPATLLIVPQPLSISRPAGADAGDTAVVLPALRALPVTVSGEYRGASTPVNGIIVRYRIDSLLPAGVPRGSAVLLNASGVTSRPDSTIAVDTTKNTGNATRTVVVPAGSGVRKVFISASARRLDGPPLRGSPVGFVLELKQQP